MASPPPDAMDKVGKSDLGKTTFPKHSLATWLAIRQRLQRDDRLVIG